MSTSSHSQEDESTILGPDAHTENDETKIQGHKPDQSTGFLIEQAEMETADEIRKRMEDNFPDPSSS